MKSTFGSYSGDCIFFFHLPVAAPGAHSLAELLPLFWRHPLPAFGHTTAPVHVPPGSTAKTAEQNAAHRQQSKRLPKTYPLPSKNGRHQQIQKGHHRQCEDSYT